MSSPALSVPLIASYHVELIDGQEIPKPLPKKPHSQTQGQLVLLLGNALPEAYEVLPELNILIGGERIIPDITVAASNARYTNNDLSDAPLLAVEILSAGQSLAKLFDRCERLMLAGTPLCWVFDPDHKRVWQYSADGLQEVSSSLRLVLPEATLEFAVADVFKKLS
jgi:Uma2 family endonuclease